MAIRDKIEDNAQPHLRTAEQVQAVFAGQTASWVKMFLLGFITNVYHTVIVTDQRILVCESGKLSTTKAKSVVGEAPRTTQIGPASGLWWPTTIAGVDLFIHKRYHKDIEQADALRPAGGGGAMPTGAPDGPPPAPSTPDGPPPAPNQADGPPIA